MKQLFLILQAHQVYRTACYLWLLSRFIHAVLPVFTILQIILTLTVRYSTRFLMLAEPLRIFIISALFTVAPVIAVYLWLAPFFRKNSVESLLRFMKKTMPDTWDLASPLISKELFALDRDTVIGLIRRSLQDALPPRVQRKAIAKHLLFTAVCLILFITAILFPVSGNSFVPAGSQKGFQRLILGNSESSAPLSILSVSPEKHPSAPTLHGLSV